MCIRDRCPPPHGFLGIGVSTLMALPPSLKGGDAITGIGMRLDLSDENTRCLLYTSDAADDM
eukprot:12065893-Alexandrium_andersonii.AAC.1